MNIQYAAGFVDGEGCIGFAKTRTSIFPRVLVTNTNLEILNEFKEKWGGDIKPLSLRKENWKQGYYWRISWAKAVNFLSDIEPYLKIKNRQAHAVFAWDEIRPGMGGKADKDSFDFLVSYVHWLNKKGINNEKNPLDVVLESIKEDTNEARSLCQY
jgi:hypothetical protein